MTYKWSLYLDILTPDNDAPFEQAWGAAEIAPIEQSQVRVASPETLVAMKESPLSIEQLQVALLENRPDKLQITELDDQLNLKALKVKWLGAGQATAPPLEDFTARVNDERWRLRE